jgi:hypothetical protein
MRRLSISLFALLLIVGACAPGTNAGMAGGEAEVLTAVQLEPYSGGTLYDAIQTERRQWLRAQFDDPVKAWLNGRELGNATELRNVLVSGVIEVRYLEPRMATAEYGVGHTSGAIVVTTR